MSAKVFFTGFRVNDELEFSEDQKMVTFSICSNNKYYNGQKLKVYVTGFDEVVSLIKRLNVKKGSFIDAIAEMQPYCRQGQYGIGYKLLNVSFCEFDSQNETKEKEKTKEESFMEAARILASNPFG